MSFLCSVKHPSCNGRCEEISEVKSLISALNDENRLRILCVLNNTNGYSTNQIVEAVELKQNLVSHHIKILFQAGLLEKEQIGLNIYYKLKHESITEKIKKLSYLLYL